MTFYTLKQVPLRTPEDEPFHSYDGINDIIPEYQDNNPEAYADSCTYKYCSKRTVYWAGDTNFTKDKSRIKYSSDINEIRRARNYNLAHNSLEGSYIGIIELFKDENGRITFGEDKV